MDQQGKSGKRVVIIMLALALGVSAIGWFAATRVERDAAARSEGAAGAVLSEGVLYQASSGDPGLVIAKDVGSGKELWRAELGSVATEPALVVDGELLRVEIAGTPWMTLDRQSGEPLE